MQRLTFSQTEKLQTLARNPFFEGLGADSLLEVAKSTLLQRYERGETLAWEGDPCAGLFILQQGCVKLFRTSPQGRQYIIRVLQEGDTCNEVPIFDGGPNPVNVTALEETTAWVVQAAAVQALMQKDPEYMRRTIRKLGAMLRHLVQITSEMAFLQIPQRLARLLDEIPAEELRGESANRWTQEQLAARLGTVREVVARAMRDLERSGAITIENRKIRICNPEILREWAQPWS